MLVLGNGTLAPEMTAAVGRGSHKLQVCFGDVAVDATALGNTALRCSTSDAVYTGC